LKEIEIFLSEKMK